MNGPGGGLSGRMTAAAVLVFLAASAVFFWPSLGNQYVLDDIPAVVQNQASHSPVDLKTIFTTNYWGDRQNYQGLTIYRPLATLSFALTDLFAPDSRAAQAGVNILLHGLVSFLVFLLALRLGLAPWLALAGGLLFLLHPIHSEAVLGVVSRAELLAALFVLAGLLLHLGRDDAGGRRYSRARAVLLFLTYCAAMLSKENGVVLLPAVLVVDLLRLPEAGRGWRAALLHRIPLHVGMTLALGAYLLLRATVLQGGMIAGELSASDNPLVQATLAERILTPFKLLYLYLAIQVWPVNLSVDYSLRQVMPDGNPLSPQVLGGLLLFALSALLFVRCFRRQQPVALLIALFYASYVVISNVPFLSTIIMAERVFYTPSVFTGLLPLVLLGLLLDWARRPGSEGFWRVAAISFLGLFAVFFAQLGRDRMADWKTPFSLAVSAVQAAPLSAKSHHLLAIELANQGRNEAALPEFQATVALDPQHFVAWCNYGATLNAAGRPDEAMRAFVTSLEKAGGRYSRARNNLCSLAYRYDRSATLEKYCRLK